MRRNKDYETIMKTKNPPDITKRQQKEIEQCKASSLGGYAKIILEGVGQETFLVFFKTIPQRDKILRELISNKITHIYVRHPDDCSPLPYSTSNNK